MTTKATVEYKNAEKYKNILENLERKLAHVKHTCGSGLIHDARQNHRLITYLLEDVSRYLNCGEAITSMFDYDNYVNGHPKQLSYQEQTESAFNKRYSSIIDKAEAFLEEYAYKGA